MQLKLYIYIDVCVCVYIKLTNKLWNKIKISDILFIYIYDLRHRNPKKYSSYFI